MLDTTNKRDEEPERRAADGDLILPFQLDSLDVRGRVCRLGPTIDTILTQHAYPPSICALVGEAAVITALIGEAMKLRGRFSLQIRTDDAENAPVSLIATDYFAPAEEGAKARMRAYARFDAARTPERIAAPQGLLGKGLFALIVDQGMGGAPYQGLAPLVPGGLAESAAAYFAQSDQIATRFKITTAAEAGPDGVERWRAGGVMLQHLAPLGESVAGSEEAAAEGKYAADRDKRLLTASDVAAMSAHADEWAQANVLLDTAEETELLGPHVSAETLLIRLYHENEPRVFSAQEVEFGCTCDREKVAALLGRYSEETLREMATDAGDITADCQFCGAHYRFDFDEALRGGNQT